MQLATRITPGLMAPWPLDLFQHNPNELYSNQGWESAGDIMCRLM